MTAPVTDQQAEFVVAHYGETYGLPLVILSTRTSHGRGLARARARELPSAPQNDRPFTQGLAMDPGPLSACTSCYRRPPRSAPPPGSRFMAFVGRLFPGAPATEVR